MTLNNDHIDYIIKDLRYRGVMAEDIDDELIDHICRATEEKMTGGKKFYTSLSRSVKIFWPFHRLSTNSGKSNQNQNL